jgi:HEAT repeat protein
LPAAVIQAAKQGEHAVRIAAIGALGRVSDPKGLSTLLEVATESDTEMVEAAKSALANLPGENVDQEIVARLSDARGKPLAVLIDLVGQRRIDASTALVKALDDSEPSVRHAALNALGATVDAKELDVLIKEVLDPRAPDDASVAQSALLAASVRMPDRDECAAELAKAMQGAPASMKATLLEILGAVGGPKSLEAIRAAANGSDEQLQDVATRLLGEWMNVEAAPVLLELAKSPAGNRYQVRALRGYIRLARQFSMPDTQRAEMCRNALAAARRADERKLVLQVLERYPSMDTLKVAVEATQVPELRADATRVAKSIAEQLEGKTEDVRELLNQIGLQQVN